MKNHTTIFNGKLKSTLVGLVAILTFAGTSAPRVRTIRRGKSNLIKHIAVLFIALFWLSVGVKWLPDGAVSARNFFLTDILFDSSFGSNGLVATDIAGSDDEAHAVVLQSDGKIIVAGRGGRWAVARYNRMARSTRLLTATAKLRFRSAVQSVRLEFFCKRTAKSLQQEPIIRL